MYACMYVCKHILRAGMKNMLGKFTKSFSIRIIRKYMKEICAIFYLLPKDRGSQMSFYVISAYKELLFPARDHRHF